MKKQITFISTIIILTVLFTACSNPLALIEKKVTAQVVSAAASAQGVSAPAQAGVPAQQATLAPTPAVPAAASGQSGLLSTYQATLENIYTQISPSVVNINVVSKVTAPSANQNSPFFNLPGMPQTPDQQGAPSTQQYSQALGSGFVWDKEGHIVTNNHVVDGADKITVVFSDGSEIPATVVGTDAYSDLAVLQVKVSADRLQPVQMADSDQVKVGQVAVAIGNPFGLEGSMTVGIVSALKRTLSSSESTRSGKSYSIPDVIQTDAPINPGNSGGVLVNDQSQVIGVTSAIESSVDGNVGIGFAIPSNIVRRVVPALIQNGHYAYAYLGISGLDLNLEMAQAMNLSTDQRGALVEEVTSGGPADKAGIRGSDRKVTINGNEVLVGGDVITAINGTTVKSMNDIIAYLSSDTEAGDKVTLDVLRSGKSERVEVTLGARPDQTSASQQANAGGNNSGAWLGIAGQTIDQDIAKALNMKTDQAGVLVEQVESGSPADKAGLQGSYKPVDINGQSVLVGGDVITQVDGKPVSSMEELRTAVQQAGVGKEIKLTILRSGQEQTVTIKLEARPTQIP